jgi:hypothetical protein
MELLRGEQRESVTQIDPHLIAECAERTGACAVRFWRAGIKNVPQQIEVLSHGLTCTARFAS